MRKKTTIILFCAFLAASLASKAQIFWTETFASPCASLCQLPFTGVNGTWTWVSTGTNGAAANTWYVSLTEAGKPRGQCGAAGSGTDASLHIGNVSTSPAAFFFCPTGDCGAAYDASSGAPSDVANARATSPVINCSGKSTITLSFNYIMGGEPAHDYATVYYYNGATWSLLASPPVTARCGSQGKWANYSVPLPASANNNAGIQIGFNWQNDANNSGNDPSFAVDSVTLNSLVIPTAPVADFTISGDSTICVGDSVHFIDKSFNGPTTWAWTFTGGSPATSSNQNPVVYYGTAGTYTVKEVVKNVSGSDSLIKVAYIHVVPGPTITVTGDTAICAGGSTTLNASGGSKYLWSPGGSTNSSITVSPASSASYTLAVSNGTCIKDTVIKVPVNPLPNVTITGATVICSAQSTLLTASGGSKYLWSNGSTTDTTTFHFNTTTSVSVLVTNASGCSKDSVFNITVNPSPSLALTASKTSMCRGDSSILTATGGGTYTWSTGATSSSITVKPVLTKGYTITVSNGLCQVRDSVTIVVDTTPVPTISPNQKLCRGSSVQLQATGGSSYTWTPSTGLSSDTISNPLAGPTATTKYIVTIANGPCATTDSVTVTVMPAPTGNAGNDTTILSGGTASIFVKPTVAGQTYIWIPSAGVSCDTCSSTTASPTTTTIYYVIVTDTADKCSRRDSIIVDVKEHCGSVFVTNAFSPTGNGVNDVFYVRCTAACVETMDFAIFDRWGNRVFHANDPNKGWDGRYMDQPMNTGTYVYYLNLTDINHNNITKKGNITLIR